MMKKIFKGLVFLTMLYTQQSASMNLTEMPLEPQQFAGTTFVSGHGRTFYVITDTRGNITMAELLREPKSGEIHEVAMRSHITDFSLCIGTYNYRPEEQVIAAKTQCPEKPYKFSMYLGGVSKDELVDGVKIKVKVSGIPFKVNFYAQKLDATQVPPSFKELSPKQLAAR